MRCSACLVPIGGATLSSYNNLHPNKIIFQIGNQNQISLSEVNILSLFMFEDM